jgi:hypothetical protein
MIFDFMKLLPGNTAPLIIKELGQNISILENTVSSSEKEFITIGEKLQEFYRQANEISDIASQITVKTSGREIQDVREGFDRMSSIVESLSGSMRTEKDTICLILDHFHAFQQPLAEFERVITMLNVLCNFIKIEIARLGLDDLSFQKLSEDVGRIAGLIGAKLKALADQAQSVIPSLLTNIALIEKCDDRQKVQGRLILEKINDDLAIISDRNDASSRTISDIAEAWGRISLSVGEVVQSLQFHDITRQRVEHVCEALDELPQKLDTLHKEKRSLIYPAIWKNRWGKSKGLPSDGYRQTDLIADTFALQAAQLQSADRDLTYAVERILQNLRHVAQDAAAISGKIISMTGQDVGGKEAFIVQIEKDINYLADSASEVARIKKDLAAAMADLSQTAMGMSVFVKDMEKIGIEMQMLALNARVHAAHLGEQGTTLGVLAESIHHLSTDTSSMVQAITLSLQAVGENAAKLDNTAGAESNTQLVQIHEDFISMLSPLKKIGEEISTLLPRIEQSGVLLADDIDHLSAGIQIHKTIGSSLAKVAAYLSASADTMITSGEKRSAHEASGLLQDLSAKYTMDSERQTHSDSAGMLVEKSIPAISFVPPENSPPITQTTGSDSGDGLGDNVELF